MGKSWKSIVFCAALLLFGLAPTVFAEGSDYRLDEDILYREGGDLSEYMRERCRLDVYYPADLEEFPTVVWFHGGGLKAGKQLMDSVKLWSLAENLGSTESLVTHPVTMTHADVEASERKRVGITDGLVRLSVGLEDADDLIDALKTALESV